MPESQTTEPTTPAEGTAPEGAEGTGASTPPAGDDNPQLGDAGKKAIDAMKSERNQARKELADVQKRLKAFEDAQKTAEQRAEESAKDAEKRAHEALQRIAAAEARAALTGVVADPKAFVEDLNLSRFITPEGEVDSDAIGKLRDKYAKSLPKVAPNPAQGANGSKPAGKQLTADDLRRMSPDEIVKAQKDGLLNSVMGINR